MLIRPIPVIVAILAAAAFSAPASAHVGPRGASSSKEPSEALTIDYVSAQPSSSGSGNYTLMVKVSGLTTPAQHDVVWFYLITPDGLGVPGVDPDLAVASPTVGGAQYSDGSQVFQISLGGVSNLSQDHLTAAEADYVPSGPAGPLHSTNTELRQEATPIALDSLPYGNLPEVPWAAGLPLVGLAVGGWWWRRPAATR